MGFLTLQQEWKGEAGEGKGEGEERVSHPIVDLNKDGQQNGGRKVLFFPPVNGLGHHLAGRHGRTVHPPNPYTCC